MSPVADPTAMDVDATRMRDEFLRRMKGKCFGCGSTAHSKREGNHERDLCAYCKRVGHRDAVCMEKFLGRGKSQKAAATGEESEVEVDTPEELSEGLEEEVLAATSQATLTQTTLAQLVEQQKALAAQIAALTQQDF
jgi:ribosome-binding protein aMBF1 (putative translation factor)